MNKIDEEIIIYFQKEDGAFTPLYYDPATCRGVIGQRENINTVTIGMKESFNIDLEKYPEVYKPLKILRSSFEELYEAARKRDNLLVAKIIEEKFRFEN